MRTGIGDSWIRTVSMVDFGLASVDTWVLGFFFTLKLKSSPVIRGFKSVKIPVVVFWAKNLCSIAGKVVLILNCIKQHNTKTYRRVEVYKRACLPSELD